MGKAESSSCKRTAAVCQPGGKEGEQACGPVADTGTHSSEEPSWGYRGSV